MAEKKKTAKSKRGRPAVYGPAILRILSEFPEELSGTVTQLARHCGVEQRSINRWMEEHEDFYQAVMRIRRRADDEVEDSLWKRAKGYTIENPVERVEEEDVWIKASDLGDENGKVPDLIDDQDKEKQVKGTKRKVSRTTQFTHVPADGAVGKWWLQNRDPANWADKRTVAVEGDFWASLPDRVDEGDSE